jgi:hypothetical protein
MVAVAAQECWFFLVFRAFPAGYPPPRPGTESALEFPGLFASAGDFLSGRHAFKDEKG